MKTYRFFCKAKCTAFGYVSADSEREALDKIKEGEYDDISDYNGFSLELDSIKIESEDEYKM